MKKNSKPVIFIVILFLILVTIVLLTMQGLRFKCEELIRERTQLASDIRSQRTKTVNLIASYQMLTSEDYVKEYALNVLGLVEGEGQQNEKILIEKNLSREISKKIKNKYE